MELENLRKDGSKPPIEWFSGFGYESKGEILVVGVNEKFTGLAGGQVGHHYNQWAHYKGNPVTPGDPPERAERARKAIAEAETFILASTGFSPQEISGVVRELNKQFKGKKEASINIELFWKYLALLLRVET